MSMSLGATAPPNTATVAAIAIDKGLAGPVTWSRWRRSLLVYATVFLLGLLLAWGRNPQWASLGLGLIFPGGGFLLHLGDDAGGALLHSLLFAGTLLLFLTSLFLWVATGNLLAPIVVWLGSAGAAAGMDHWADGAAFIAMTTLCRSAAQTGPQLLADARLAVPLATLSLLVLALTQN